MVTDEGKSVSSMFTFAEVPGLENAEGERFSKMIFEKDIEVNYIDVLHGGAPLQPSLELQGAFVAAKLPDELPGAYVLESFCEWGTWSEGGAPPALIRYYTSASKIDKGEGDDEKVHQASTNKFRLDLQLTHHSQKCSGQGTHNHQSTCIEVKAVYDDVPVSNSNITVAVAGTDSGPINLVSDANGIAHVSVLRAHKRVFARAGHKINTSGETAEGEVYELISNWATSVLELGTYLEAYPPPSTSDTPSTESTEAGSNASSSSGQPDGGSKLQGLSAGNMILVVLVTFVGSFVGSIMSDCVCNRRRGYAIGNVVDDATHISLDLEKAEAC